MTRAFHASFDAAAQSINPQPTLLVAIETGDGTTPWIRLTNSETTVSHDGNDYSPRPFEFGEFDVANAVGKSTQLRLADVDSYFSTWLLTSDFRWKSVARYRIDRTVSDKAQLDWFRIVSRSRSDREFIFTVEPRLAILSRIRLPGQVLTREEFPGIPDSGVIG